MTPPELPVEQAGDPAAGLRDEPALTGASVPGVGGEGRGTAMGQTANHRHIIAVWIAVVAFSFGPVMAATAHASGVVISFWRLWFGVPLLGAIALFQLRRAGEWPRWPGWKWAGLAGVAFALHQVTLMSALQETSVVDVTLMNTLAPMVVAGLAVPLFGERPGLSFRAWSAVAILGAALVAVAGSTGPDGNPFGITLAASNVVFYALFFVLSKQSRPHIDVAPFLACSLLVAAAIVSGWVLVTGVGVLAISSRDLLLCLGIAVFPGLVGHSLITWSLRWVPANLPPVIMLTMPAMSGALAWVILDQRVTGVQVVGGVVTVIGVFGAVWKSAALAPTSIESLDLAEGT